MANPTNQEDRDQLLSASNQIVEPMWLELTGALASVARSTGREGFLDHMLWQLEKFLHIDHCAVFSIERNAKLRVKHIATAGRLPSDLGSSLGLHYANEMSQFDPNIQAIRLAPEQGVGRPLMRPARPVYPEKYFAHFFEETRLVDKISYFQKLGIENLLYINYYRLDDTGRFKRADHHALSQFAPILGCLIAQHVSQSVDRAPSTNRDRARSKLDLPEPFYSDLTERERDVCSRILAGEATAQISNSLGIAQSSVITYRRRAYAKIGVKSKVQLFHLLINGTVDKIGANVN